MLSVILYGRNDDHGYNYHKRLAISINCIAEMLSHKHDEILYSDYNSPNDFPTILEAIEDTLTEKSKSLLKILRIRPALHRQYAKKTKLEVLESLARNAAIRRSSPENRWILSTNSDMIFIPKNPEKSLSSLVAELEDGFYLLPRFELPEQLWELSLERTSPQKNLSFLRDHYKKLHLNSIVRMPGFLQFDNPGDFQLILRKDLFQIGGFDENMLLGWNVDANLCKRMLLLRGPGKSLETELLGFHCNHTRKETIAHTPFWKKNSWRKFVSRKNLSPVLNQDKWGFAGQEIEQFSLLSKKSAIHLEALKLTLEKEPEKDYDFLLNKEFYNSFIYSPARIFSFLSDQLIYLPEDSIIAYLGSNQTIPQMLNCYLSSSNSSKKILVLPDQTTLSQASAIIFDFGIESRGTPQKTKSLKKILRFFFQTTKSNRIRNKKLIGINMTHTDFKFAFLARALPFLNSYSTGIICGFSNKINVKNKIICSLLFILKKATNCW